MVSKNEKSLSIKTPTIVPLKSDKRTFFEYSAKPIAIIDGSNERKESSMAKT